ncbi:hypothetical protein HQN86_16785 [Pedobacter panaciterrae]|uniref:hypothetical protein n=1 Tax=Pedobacter panaciterrae TaxID=363849 RepID=UPI00155DDBD0|nr:hypothetical protein [Pedobacter panaciterrae]NQX55281.1 hypothetical protein [Pedobacter panaciterrae]
MKTSNKLLIIFALLMFIIPLTIMAYTINKDYKFPEQIKAQETANANFNTPSDGFVTLKSKAFKSISVRGRANKSWYLNLVNDAAHGAKVSEVYKDFVSMSVDENEQLHIIIKGDHQEIKYPIAIYVYAPKIEELNLSDLDAITVNFKNSEVPLRLNAKNVFLLNLEKDFNVSHLDLFEEKVNDLVLIGEGVKTLNLDLKSSRFKSEMKSFDSLNVKASGGSELNIFGDEQGKTQFGIKQLTLNTSGKVDVNLTDMKLNNVSGNLSDETMIKIPMAYLKKMIK